MKDKLIKHIFPDEKISQIFNSLKNNKTTFISRAYGSARAFLIDEIFKTHRKILVLAESSLEVDELSVELELLCQSDVVVNLNSITEEILQEKLTEISERSEYIFIATYSILKITLPSPKQISDNTLKIELGTDINFDELIEYFSLYNYQRDKYVQNPGDFSTRGSLIDFWSYSEKLPCRIEFDGDFIESIRYFDSESQRSIGKINSVTLAANVIENISDDKSANIFSYLSDALIFANQQSLNSIADKNPEENILIDEDLDKELIEDIYENIPVKTESGRNETEIESVNNLFQYENKWVIENDICDNETCLKLGITENPLFQSNFKLLLKFIDEQCYSGKNIIITTENELQQKRMSDLIIESDKTMEELSAAGKIKVIVLPIKKGFTSKNSGLIFLTDYEIFNKPYRTKLPSESKLKKTKSKDLSSLNVGDFVVHETFGIGKYAGLETIKIGSSEQESIKILYAEGDVVYVNLNYLSLVKKFSSKENVEPKITNLKSNEWKSAKRKVKSKIKEAAKELIILYAKRKSAAGFAFSPDSVWQKELEASFIYEDTPDQMKVTEEVKHDMESPTPMDRLVCGDVGFGKTEIAVRAAFKCVNDGKQVAVLVPTTILAEQHFNTFRDRLGQYPVKIEMLSRFVQTKKQKEIVQQLEEGSVDIIIGTHRLLSKDIKFKDLGLLIIDEEQRFGVMAKEKIRSVKANVDTLTLTATPIPRTLNLSLLGARDLSIIGTPPPNRQPIYTNVSVFDIHKIRQWILSEVRRGGQVYFIHDRVHSIQKIAAYLQKYIPEINFGIAHGQMKPLQLENVIHDFMNKKIEVLLSTKIVESGLDIPNTNTIIINRADRFGLSELHQLRGRVGRSDKQAYAYLLVPSLDSVSKKAVRRLNAIEEYTELGEGFNISMRDLEIRGAGNLLGTEQSGVIDTVGFDLYLKLLDEAVNELKQNEFKNEFKDLPKTIQRTSPTIDTYFDIGIPKNYMPDQADRLSFYSSLFSIVNIESIDEIIEEMNDRFGKPPIMIERLIQTAKLRFFASVGLIEKISVNENKCSIFLPKADREEYYQNKFPKLLKYITERFSKEIFFIQEKTSMKLEIKKKFSNPESTLNYLIELIKNINVICELN
jgi:transcription-repair coupling factor (superfamily II helicase)